VVFTGKSQTLGLSFRFSHEDQAFKVNKKSCKYWIIPMVYIKYQLGEGCRGCAPLLPLRWISLIICSTCSFSFFFYLTSQLCHSLVGHPLPWICPCVLPGVMSYDIVCLNLAYNFLFISYKLHIHVHCISSPCIHVHVHVHCIIHCT